MAVVASGSQLVGSRLEIDGNRYGVHDDRRTVFGQHGVQHWRNDLSVDRQRYVVRPVGVQRKYRHLLPAILGRQAAVGRLVPASLLRFLVTAVAAAVAVAVRRVVKVGGHHHHRVVQAVAAATAAAVAADAAVLRAKPLFDVRLELVHGTVGRIRRVGRERHVTTVQ